MSELAEALLTCPRCGSEQLWRNGRTVDGRQMYRCRDCGCQCRQGFAQGPRRFHSSRKRDGSLTSRQSEVLQLIQSDPLLTLQNIADKIGVTRERIRQIAVRLNDMGLIDHRKDLRINAIRCKREEEAKKTKETREYRKQIWRRMMYIGLRQRLRYMAHISPAGLPVAHHMPGQESVCLFKGCAHPVAARGFCRNHYGQLRSTGALWVRRSSRRICKIDDCIAVVYARELCKTHYAAYKRKHHSPSILPHHNTSGYRGVSPTQYNTWQANIRIPGGRQQNLGCFESKEMAARAYDTAARKYLGEHAKLNFPNENIEVVKEKKEYTYMGRAGIYWDERKERWYVRIYRHNKPIYVGRFIDLGEAMQARDNAVLRHT